MDTIFAVSSGAPPAAIAVLRLSGPAACESVRAIAGELPPARRAGVRALRDPADGELLDRALVLLFPGPASATGEDVVELHLHGGRAVVAAVERVLAASPGCRRAQPGEFTRRAVTNGRLDLTEAEGLGDLLLAETEAQRQVASSATEGAVRRAVSAWRDELLQLSALVEAAIEFEEEEDVAAAASLDRGRVEQLAWKIETVLAQPPVERLRDGVRVVLAGAPNTGKSTLFNALLERDAAITSPVAGTTRDRIEASVTRGGVAYRLIDTAGLTETPGDAIEAIGVGRAHDALAEAEIILWLDDGPPPTHAEATLLPLHARSDVAGRTSCGDRLSVSASTGEGLATLWEALAEKARSLLPRPDMLAVNERQRGELRQAVVALQAAADEADPLLVAEGLRSALVCFDRVTGTTGVEEMLDGLFSRFCIGK